MPETSKTDPKITPEPLYPHIVSIKQLIKMSHTREEFEYPEVRIFMLAQTGRPVSNDTAASSAHHLLTSKSSH